LVETNHAGQDYSRFSYVFPEKFWNIICPFNIKIKLYKALIRPVVVYGSEWWVLTENIKQKLLVFESIRQKTGAQNIIKEIKQYQKKWLQHVQRMDTNRLPKQALQYKLKGRRNIGRPRKKWRDQIHLEDQGTGNTPNPS